MKSEFACKEWGGDLHLSLCWGPPPHLGGEGPYLYRASGRQEGGGFWGARCGAQDAFGIRAQLVAGVQGVCTPEQLGSGGRT